MICEGISNRADLKIGSVFTLKEDFKNADNEQGYCSHDDLLICGITHYTDIKGNYENKFIAIAANSELPPYPFRDWFPKIETQQAVVRDNKDPEQLGRVRVQFLWQKEQDNDLITPWIRIAQPHGGGDKGFYFIPEIDEDVMVGFENGNAEKPYVIGTLFHNKQKPGKQWPNDNNSIKAIRTRNGHTIEIHDGGIGGFIRIYDYEKENYSLTFSTDEKLIKLQSLGNIELIAGGEIIMQSGGNINIKAGSDMSCNAGNDISISADNNNSINAGNDMTTNIGNNETLYVGKHQTIEIGAGKQESIEENYQLTIKDILIYASEKLQLYSKKHIQKSEEMMQLDGGTEGIDLYADSIRIN
jgi:uncharacterized protein involved in type VI secretion and phage assembly